MSLHSLNIHNFRNIIDARLSLDKSTLLVGKNGSGKTSVLEAIYMLAYGKSFRNTNAESVINREQQSLVVSGVLDDGRKLGIERQRNGKFSIRLNGEAVNKISELSRLSPTHVIEPNAVVIVEGAPTERRRFLDFTMFHVEHSYLEIHKRFSNALKQRNAILKEPQSARSQLLYWNRLYIESAWALLQLRQSLFDEFLHPGFKETAKFLMDEEIEYVYLDGSKSAKTKEEFESLLEESLELDLRYRTSQLGPHRADILLKHKGKLAKDYLSRGQKKLLTYGVRLAPPLMLKRLERPMGQILIDDMPSELDVQSVSKVCSLLQHINTKTVLTAVDETNQQVDIIRNNLNPQMFHVEHGVVSSQSS